MVFWHLAVFFWRINADKFILDRTHVGIQTSLSGRYRILGSRLLLRCSQHSTHTYYVYDSILRKLTVRWQNQISQNYFKETLGVPHLKILLQILLLSECFSVVRVSNRNDKRSYVNRIHSHVLVWLKVKDRIQSSFFR